MSQIPHVNWNTIVVVLTLVDKVVEGAVRDGGPCGIVRATDGGVGRVELELVGGVLQIQAKTLETKQLMYDATRRIEDLVPVQN